MSMLGSGAPRGNRPGVAKRDPATQVADVNLRSEVSLSGGDRRSGAIIDVVVVVSARSR